MTSVLSKFKPSKKVAIGLGAAASLAAAAALGAVISPGPNAVIHGCFDRNGNLRVIDPATQTCRRDESPISWNEQGQKGDLGQKGDVGPKGDIGPSGKDGVNGKDGLPGRDGRDGVQGPQGVTGATGPQGPTGPAGKDGVGSTGGGSTGGGSVDLFLKADDIQGESKDAQHPGEILIDSYGFGVANSSTIGSAGGGAGAGKAQFTSLTFTKHTDKSSPVFFVDAASGKHLKEVVITARKAGGAGPLEFVKITMDDVLISSIDTAGESNNPIEKVSISFGKIKIEYTPQKPDGSADATVVGGWDIVANKEG